MRVQIVYVHTNFLFITRITTIMDKKFCHHCGNDTLRRLAVSINDDGTMKYYLSKRPPKLCKKVTYSYMQTFSLSDVIRKQRLICYVL